MSVRPALLALILLATLPGVFFIGPFSVTVPIVVPDILQAGDKWVGLLWGCFGAGVFLCPLALTVWPIPRRGLAICLSTVSGGAGLTFYGLSETLYISAIVLVLWGAGAAVFINYVIALLQENTEPRMMGRVMSMYSLAFFASSPIGYLQAGLVTTAFGPQVTLLSSGLISIALGVACVVLLKPVRDLQ
jgi:MFS transporter, ENTS family, enterobactin (siderophore) exporter